MKTVMRTVAYETDKNIEEVSEAELFDVISA